VLNYLVLVLMISRQKYHSKVFILQFLKKKFDRKVYILFIKKIKNKYMSPFYV